MGTNKKKILNNEVLLSDIFYTEPNSGNAGVDAIIKYEQVRERPLPLTYREMRTPELLLTKISDVFFSIMAKEKKEALENKRRKLIEEARRKGIDEKDVVVDDYLPEYDFTELDFEALIAAIGKNLYNQGIQSGNKTTSTGLMARIATIGDDGDTKAGKDRIYGVIGCTITSLCRDGHGVDEPTTQQRNSMAALIDKLSKTPLPIEFPNGDIIDLLLCTIWAKLRRRKDNAQVYSLQINPIYSDNMKGYSETTQDFYKMLNQYSTKRTAAAYRLARMLKAQDTRKDCIRTIATLCEELGYTEAYKTKRIRVEKEIIKLCDVQKNMGILITSYDKIYITKDRKTILDKIIFHPNPDRKKIKKDDKPTV